MWCEMEDKSDKFIRIASARTERVILTLKSIQKLSNSNHYTYTEIQVEEILKAIKVELEATRTVFAAKRDRKKFKLSRNDEA